MPEPTLEELASNIIDCHQCPRLREHCAEVAKTKTRKYQDHAYWGKPVPNFGDPQARVMIIGLAPAAHGANRTGRMFTGDKSGDWLYQALYETGFSNQPTSTGPGDGLEVNDVFITAAARCAPPQNKPTTGELNTCSQSYLKPELALLPNLQVVLCLGRIAFDSYRKLQGIKRLTFQHKAFYNLEDQPHLMLAYHPSRQNTQTGRLKWDSWVSVFQEVKNTLR
jgi:uracil-DNA glycosylase family 4